MEMLEENRYLDILKEQKCSRYSLQKDFPIDLDTVTFGSFLYEQFGADPSTMILTESIFDQPLSKIQGL